MPPMPALPNVLPEAPGAKAARTCGLLSILFAVTCAGIPVAIVLGIVALVQHAKAKRQASEFPQDYRPPTASGFVMGLVGLVLPMLLLPFLGIMAAIAAPAYLGYRGRGPGQDRHRQSRERNPDPRWRVRERPGSGPGSARPSGFPRNDPQGCSAAESHQPPGSGLPLHDFHRLGHLGGGDQGEGPS